ncbi:galactoside alpha-(1,2)-fucosyltransferase 1-like [Uloborus diversus]|uniref:galactoside alpha-(1,2)-fucosyltransferase 1-like n=1 Tax=Uloborus diversus TaxID=327109 RepID=UPI0024091008|nr:galactoside alpha-(1,2)-fucosyltransferase 1-like [Uloborus diversus]
MTISNQRRSEPTENSWNVQPLTIRPNEGRLGNQMFSLATLYGLGYLNRRRIALMPDTFKALSHYFDLTVPQVNTSTFNASNPWQIGFWLSFNDSSIPVSSNIISGNLYPTSFTFFQHVRDRIRPLFRFKPMIRDYAQNLLRHLKRVHPWTDVYIGVHVRRGDYLRKGSGGWLRAANGREVDLLYFQKAVDYFRNRYGNVTFLAVSDDRKWCKRNLSQLGILTVPDSPSPGHDLALLAECNHTIMTYGTYGFWGGYLSGGTVVYFTDFVKPNTTVAKKFFVYEKIYPPEWIGISTTKPGYWESYTNPFLIP